MSHSLIADLIRDRDRLQARCAELEKALREADRWFDGWCPNAKCCAHTGKAVHEQVRRALHEKGRDGNE